MKYFISLFVIFMALPSAVEAYGTYNIPSNYNVQCVISQGEGEGIHMMGVVTLQPKIASIKIGEYESTLPLKSLEKDWIGYSGNMGQINAFSYPNKTGLIEVNGKVQNSIYECTRDVELN